MIDPTDKKPVEWTSRNFVLKASQPVINACAAANLNITEVSISSTKQGSTNAPHDETI